MCVVLEYVAKQRPVCYMYAKRDLYVRCMPKETCMLYACQKRPVSHMHAKRDLHSMSISIGTQQEGPKRDLYVICMPKETCMLYACQKRPA